MSRSRHARRLALALAGAVAPLGAMPTAQVPDRVQFDTESPVTFTAGSVAYDREQDRVTASGGVEAWQGERVLRADSIVFDRRRDIAIARGNVALLEPNGEVLFADEIELSSDFRDGIARNIGALLADNGRFAAAGARRSGGTLLELARAIYSSCDTECPEERKRREEAGEPAPPPGTPLWQIKAERVVQDRAQQRIEYRDATMEVAGIPVVYLPYFWHAEPGPGRRSGFLAPSIGSDSFLGGFARLPYYWVTSEQDDITLTPLVTTEQRGGLSAEYRRRFNDGFVSFRGSAANDADNRWRNDVGARGRFAIDDEFRWGFDAARASDKTYLRRYKIDSSRLLTSTAFLEGFGENSYTRLDAFSFQGLRETDDQDRIPFVVPRFGYAYDAPEDRLGGRLGLDVSAWGVGRSDGTDSTRLAGTAIWRLPFDGPLGQKLEFRSQLDLIGYNANDLDRAPNFSPADDGVTGRALPQLALSWRWPFLRSTEDWGSQVLEPIAQLVTRPNVGRQDNIPNEDSLDLEFTDATLFEFNRFPGRDRMEGGSRIDLALRGAWYVNDLAIDGIIGQSIRFHQDDTFAQGSGLEDRRSDYVARLSVAPSEHVDLTWRTRLDPDNLDHRFSDLVGSVGSDRLRVSAGYLFTPPVPEQTPSERREEIGLGLSGRLSRYWRAGVAASRDLDREEYNLTSAFLAYEDECLLFDIRFRRDYGRDELGTFGSAILFRIVFKTIGEVGFSAL